MGHWIRLGVSLLAAGALFGQPKVATVFVDNPYGSVTAKVTLAERANIQSSCDTRALRAGDVQLSRQDSTAIILVRPTDGATVNVVAEIPPAYRFQAKTKDGAVTIEGVVHRAEILTDTGELHFQVPLAATRIEILSEQAAEEIAEPPGFKFKQSIEAENDGRESWYFRDELPTLKVTSSKIVVNAIKPRKLTLENSPIPIDWPLKPPWMAPAVLEDVLAGVKNAKRSRNSKPKRKRDPKPAAAADSGDVMTVDEGIPRFSSNVRLVNLSAAVFDAQGHPLTNLDQDDFEVIENGVPQELEFVGAEEVSFNLAMLLDMSGSTRRDREAIKEGAKGFVDIARPQDKTAAYALANNIFQQVAPLGTDRSRTKRLIEAIPQVSGGSPLYDMIVLSYAHELQRLPAERNALIVISDGVDNRVYGTGAQSNVTFKELRRAAEGMSLLIYPIFLEQFTAVPPPRWAKKARSNLQELADTTGGRLFVARSIRDLDPVYPQVAEELRSVYTLTYYPADQKFDGSWRNVQVRVKKSGARVRTRLGYFAK
jgi:Ca-activated chloride channel homolog